MRHNISTLGHMPHGCLTVVKSIAHCTIDGTVILLIPTLRLPPTLHRVLRLTQGRHHINAIGLASELLDLWIL